MADEMDKPDKLPHAGEDPRVDLARSTDNLDAVLAELRAEVAKSKEETVDTERLERLSARLIEEVAEDLASTREVAGLPPKKAHEFRDLIERRRTLD